jgi:hypothetical protein
MYIPTGVAGASNGQKNSSNIRKVASYINEHYYAVKFNMSKRFAGVWNGQNTEQSKTIRFSLAV